MHKKAIFGFGCGSFVTLKDFLSTIGTRILIVGDLSKTLEDEAIELTYLPSSNLDFEGSF